MNISMLKIKNCLGVTNLEFNPGEITLIEGEEGQGKTSVLESIQRFFTNKSERPVFVNTDGEKAEMYLMLDDGTDMKKYINKEGKATTLSIDKGGMSPKNPETFLKGLVSEKQLNPISLIGMKDKELAELILSLIPINITEEDLKDWIMEVPPVDISKHGLQVCKDIEMYYYNKRTDLNKETKLLDADITSMISKLPSVYDVEAWRNVSLQEKYNAISTANLHNKKIDEAVSFISSVDAKIETLREQCKSEIAEMKVSEEAKSQGIKDKIIDLKNQIALLEKDLENRNNIIEENVKNIKESYKDKSDKLQEEKKSSEKFIADNKAIDIEVLEADLKEADEMRSYIAIADELKSKVKILDVKKEESETLTHKIEFMRTKPAMLLKTVKMPVDGLSTDNNGNVLINDRPISNLSGGERIKFVMNIVRATAGELKIILIDGFEKLSPKGQAEFIDECKGDGFQYIITKVTDGELKITSIDANGNKIDAVTGEII